MKTLDEINDEFKNLAITRNNLIDDFLEDLKDGNSLTYELRLFRKRLIKKWEAKKNGK